MLLSSQHEFCEVRGTRMNTGGFQRRLLSPKNLALRSYANCTIGRAICRNLQLKKNFVSARVLSREIGFCGGCEARKRLSDIFSLAASAGSPARIKRSLKQMQDGSTDCVVPRMG